MPYYEEAHGPIHYGDRPGAVHRVELPLACQYLLVFIFLCVAEECGFYVACKEARIIYACDKVCYEIDEWLASITACLCVL